MIYVRLLWYVKGHFQKEKPRPSPAGLAQLAQPYPVDPPVNHDLGMLAIANIAAEHTRATAP